MLLKLFKSSNPIILILSMFIGAGLWIPGIISNAELYIPNAQVDTPLFLSLYNFLGQSTLLYKGIAFILILLMSFILSRLNFQFIFIETKTQLPTFFFLILCSLFPFYQTIHPSIIGNIAFLFAIWRCFPMSKEKISIKQYYETGFILGLGSLFYMPTAVFIFIVWVTQIVLRNFNLREWVASLVGLVSPIIFYFTVLFLYDKESTYFEFLSNFFSNVRTDIMLKNLSLIGVGFIALLLFIGIVFLVSIIGARKITTRKNFTMMLWILIYCVVVKVVFPFIGTEIYFFFAFPASVILAKYFVELRKKIFGEILFTLFLLASVYTIWIQL